MSKTTIIAVVVVAVVLIGGGLWFWTGQSAPAVPYVAPSPSPTSPEVPPPTTTLPPPGNPPAQPTETGTTPTPKPETYTVTGNDLTGSPTSITVHKGDTVQITFNVEANGTYHGGLDFRSSLLNTGTILPGASKTVTFTAGDSFVFTPYWPSSNIKKPYTISVLVQ